MRYGIYRWDVDKQCWIYVGGSYKREFDAWRAARKLEKKDNSPKGHIRVGVIDPYPWWVLPAQP